MGFSAVLRPNLPAAIPPYSLKLSLLRRNLKQKELPFVTITKGKGHGHSLLVGTTGDSRLQIKQLETELAFTKEDLKTKEMEVLAAQRALTIKDEKLKKVLRRLDEREKELKTLKEEMIKDANDLKKLYALAQEIAGDKSIGDLAIEKLELEAAQLEVEAATSVLQKLAEMSRELLIKILMSTEFDFDFSIFPQSGIDNEIITVENKNCFTEIKTEVARLSSLTDQQVKEAGIVVADR